jgi:hypothetical protein
MDPCKPAEAVIVYVAPEADWLIETTWAPIVIRPVLEFEVPFAATE